MVRSSRGATAVVFGRGGAFWGGRVIPDSIRAAFDNDVSRLWDVCAIRGIPILPTFCRRIRTIIAKTVQMMPARIPFAQGLSTHRGFHRWMRLTLMTPGQLSIDHWSEKWMRRVACHEVI